MTAKTFLDGRVTLYPGDCLEVLASLPENSVDSVVVDPPYHLTNRTPDAKWCVECRRVLGGNDGNPRTCPKCGGALEYQRSQGGRGFMGKQWDGGDIAFQPATWAAVLRVLKPGGYLLAFASTRGIWRMGVAIEDAGFISHPMIAWVFGSGFPKATRIKAEGYDGFRYGGQALKPAIEPIYMGQKPFSEATGTANILKWGTGAVNVDGRRVAGNEDTARPSGVNRGVYGDRRGMIRGGSDLGRWPANIILDGSEEVLAGFPDAPGQGGSVSDGEPSSLVNNVYSDRRRVPTANPRSDTGSAARFFYQAKADTSDRLGSRHPTVKPLDLMQYLCRLITPPGGTILDPFAGTGTTGEAAWREGFKAILIEREPEYQADIARRMELAVKPAKRAATAKAKGKLQGAEGTPLFGDFA